VHAGLEKLFDKERICRARVNEELVLLSLQDIKKLRVFSGHLDWSLLDCVPYPKFVFTILREPTERILSMYFFLRESAKALSEEQINQPWYGGHKAALQWSCDDYFCSIAPGFRGFLNTQYDNVYTYYFAGRTFRGHHDISDQQARLKFSDDFIVELALKNMSALDAIYSINELSNLERDLSRIAGRSMNNSLAETKINIGESDPAKRFDTLRELGATQATFDKIEQMTRLDRQIWEKFCR